MIFNENYDRSLWLMLAGDEKNRHNIAECIKKIPMDIHEKICLLIQFSNEFDKKMELQWIRNGYNIIVEIDGGLLKIAYYNVLNDVECNNNNFEISLSLMNCADILNRKIPEDLFVGEFVYMDNKSKICQCCGNEISAHGVSRENYYLLSGSLTVERVHKGVCGLETTYKRRVKLYEMPSKMYIHQLENSKRIKRLIREK